MMSNVEENKLFIKEVARQLMPYLLHHLEPSNALTVKESKEV